MELEQYVGCIVMWNGRPAEIVGVRDCYDGISFLLCYTDASDADSFDLNIYEDDVMSILPDPKHGIIKRKGKDVIFLYRGVEYELTDQPYEPCLYIKKDGAIFRTLHNAFTAYDLPEYFAQGNSLTAIDGKKYGKKDFCKVLAAAIDGDRSEMDFTFAAGLVK